MEFLRVFDRWRANASRLAAVSATALLLVGCGGGAAKNDTFDLSAVPTVEGPAATSRQILIPEPSALKALNSEQIVIRLTGSEIQYLAASQWSDRLPRMYQQKLVEAFENTGKVGGVGKPGEGLAIDYQIISDIRSFEISTGGADTAIVEIAVKIVNDRNGSVRAQQVFRATSAVSGAGNPAFIKALDTASSKVTADIVGWTLREI